MSVDQSLLAAYDRPALLTSGDQSPPVFAPVERRLAQLLPQARQTTYAGAGHIPHVTHPAAYVAEVIAFIDWAEANQR
ncbi:alpha/beta fold hydrolase [Nocardioides guangzhouensis]|uniref:alpha/beta fold hydrolase n=1 Tax=Nocardioides guangzhouensis TaxID=2497878 RepID=UPI001C37AF9D|nr:alpha/beta hydrolase [Nocardioides guangzhouensis]